MPALATCLKRLSKVVSADDAATLQLVYSQKVADGMSGSDAAVAAVDELAAEVFVERMGIEQRITQAGGQATPAWPAGTLVVQ